MKPVRLKVDRYERIKRACPSCKDSLLDEAARQELMLREALAYRKPPTKPRFRSGRPSPSLGWCVSRRFYRAC